MLVLYKSLHAILSGDTTLANLIGADAADPHIYQTYIQFHSEAALRNKFWITYNKASDVADDTQQTQMIRVVRIDIHIWGRDTNSDTVDEAEDRVRALLDGANIGTSDMLAWYCIQQGESQRGYEVDQKACHSISTYEAKVADNSRLPT